MKKIGVFISTCAFIVSMFFPSFQGVDTKIFEYKQLTYFELVKEKWWVYVLLLVVLLLTIVLSNEQSKILSIVFASGFVFLNLSLLSLENNRFFINGYPMLWGYSIVVFLGLLVSIMLVSFAYDNN